MRQALIVGIIGALEALVALWWASPWAAPLAWTAVVTLGMAVAIGTRRTWVLGKREDGAIPAWSLVVFWPWHLFTRIAARAHRRAGEPFTEVADGWWIGGWPRPGDVPDVAVLDLTCELPRQVPSGAYRCVPTWDQTAPTAEGLDQAVAWVLERRAAGDRVLVHCAHGRGRSATVLVAALVAEGAHTTWQEAYAAVGKRRLVRLSGDQRALLERWEANRKGRVVPAVGSP